MNPRTVRTTARVGAGAVAVAALCWVTSTGAMAATVCTPTTDRPTLEVEPGPVAIGSTVKVTGAGWCNELDGGSRVAIKLDDGAYSHLDDVLHPNRTIWALVDADPADGSFSYDLQLPDGTDETSEPAFVEGSHFLRALTGSIKDGDPVRTVRSATDFAVGAHRPSGVPDPVDSSDLTEETGRAVTAAVAKGRLKVDVAGGEKGDWVFLSVLTEDGSPRYPWLGAWHQLDADGRVEVGEGDEPVHGAHRLVVQDGNAGHVGDLVGWTDVEFSAKKPTKATTPKKTTKNKKTAKKPTATPTPVPVSRTLTPVTRVPLPTVTPEPEASLPKKAPKEAPKEGTKPTAVAEPQPPASPVRRWSGFWEADELPAEVSGDELVVSAGASETVHVHVHDATSSVAAGWVKTDADGRVRLDVGELPPGRYRFALQQGDEDYLGWAALEVPEEGDMTTTGRKSTIGSLVAAASGDDDGSGPDGWLAGMGLMLLVGVGLGTVSRRKATR